MRARRGARPRVEPGVERPPWSSRRRGPARAARQVPPSGPRGGGAEPRDAARPEPPARLDATATRLPAARRLPGPSPCRPALLTCLSRCRRWRPSIPPFSSGRLRHGSRRCRLGRRAPHPPARDVTGRDDALPARRSGSVQLGKALPARGAGRRARGGSAPCPGACALLAARAGPAHCLRLRLWTDAPRVLSTAVSRSRRWSRALSPGWPSCLRPPTGAAVDKGFCVVSSRGLHLQHPHGHQLTFKVTKFPRQSLNPVISG